MLDRDIATGRGRRLEMLDRDIDTGRSRRLGPLAQGFFDCDMPDGGILVLERSVFDCGILDGGILDDRILDVVFE